MAQIDLGPAAREMANLIRGIPDDRLGEPTPCEDYCLGDLLDHLAGFALAFTAAARKTPLDTRASGDASKLGDDWRTRIPAVVDELVLAWRDPEAWTGMTAAGGIDLPGEMAGVIALDELVIHGWDVAKASGQSFSADEASLGAVEQFVQGVADLPKADIFGPPVKVADDAPRLDQIIALTGRDPDWSPT